MIWREDFVDCELARQLLIFARPGSTELDAGEVAALEAHLADCADCRVRNRNERDWDDRVARAMGVVTIPNDGRTRLDERLGQERRDWHRRLCTALVICGLVVSGAWWA